MTAHDHEPAPDQVTLTGADTAIYEAIATLEFVGHPATLSDIAAAVNLDYEAVLAALVSLTARGLLVRTDEGGEPAYQPAWRGWSTAPDQAAGHGYQ